MQITADNVQEVTDRINMIVQTNSTEEQSSENLQAVTGVLSNTVNLLGIPSAAAAVKRPMPRPAPMTISPSPIAAPK